MHRKPVKRGLVERHGDWRRSSFRVYAVSADELSGVAAGDQVLPVIRKPANEWGHPRMHRYSQNRRTIDSGAIASTILRAPH